MTTHGNTYQHMANTRRQCVKSDDFMILCCDIASYIWSQTKYKSTRKPMVKVRIAQNSHYSSTKIWTPSKKLCTYSLILITFQMIHTTIPNHLKGSPTWDFDSRLTSQGPGVVSASDLAQWGDGIVQRLRVFRKESGTRIPKKLWPRRFDFFGSLVFFEKKGRVWMIL